MVVRIDRLDTLSLVYATGEIDALTCGQLEDAMKALLDSGEMYIVLDMSGTVYISSAGLRVVLVTAKRLYGEGRFAIAAVNQDVRETLEIAGLANIVDIYDTADEAAAAISENGG